MRFIVVKSRMASAQKKRLRSFCLSLGSLVFLLLCSFAEGTPSADLALRAQAYAVATDATNGDLCLVPLPSLPLE